MRRTLLRRADCRIGYVVELHTSTMPGTAFFYFRTRDAAKLYHDALIHGRAWRPRWGWTESRPRKKGWRA